MRVLARLAALSSDTTHPHPKGRAAAFVVAQAAASLLCDGEPCANALRAPIAALQRAAALAEAGDSWCGSVADRDTVKYLEALDALPRWSDDAWDMDFGALLGPRADWGLDVSSMHTAGAALYVAKHARSAAEALAVSV